MYRGDDANLQHCDLTKYSMKHYNCRKNLGSKYSLGGLYTFWKTYSE